MRSRHGLWSVNMKMEGKKNLSSFLSVLNSITEFSFSHYVLLL